MRQPCRSHRPITKEAVRTADDAIRTLLLATDEGHSECVVLACVDVDRLPLTLFVFDGRSNLDDDLEAALEAVLAAAASVDSPLCAVFLGSSRPGREQGPAAVDERRWVRMFETCADAGVELLDWFLVNNGAVCSVAESLRPGPGW